MVLSPLVRLWSDSVGGPVAMGYVRKGHAACLIAGTALELEVRGKRLPAKVQMLPFAPSSIITAKRNNENEIHLTNEENFQSCQKIILHQGS